MDYLSTLARKPVVPSHRIRMFDSRALDPDWKHRRAYGALANVNSALLGDDHKGVTMASAESFYWPRLGPNPLTLLYQELYKNRMAFNEYVDSVVSMIRRGTWPLTEYLEGLVSRLAGTQQDLPPSEPSESSVRLSIMQNVAVGRRRRDPTYIEWVRRRYPHRYPFFNRSRLDIFAQLASNQRS